MDEDAIQPSTDAEGAQTTVPLPPSPLEEAQSLQVKIAEGMPTDTEMRTGIPRTVQRHIDWEKRNRRSIARYHELRKAHPNLPSVESLRLP